MKTYRIQWLGIPGIDITAGTIQEALELCARHQLDFLMANLDQIDGLRRELAEGSLSPTFSSLTISGDDDGSLPNAVTDEEGAADIVVRLFPEAR